MSEIIFSAKNRQGLKAAIDDLYKGLKMVEIWRSFAIDEIQNRYRRSVLGLAWIAIAYLVFVLVINLFFKGLSSQSGSNFFLFHVCLGYAAFTFIMGNISDGCEVYRNSMTWIKSTPLPYSIYVYKSIFRSLFTFAIHFAVALLVMLFLGWRPSPQIFMLIPVFGIYLINAVPLQTSIGLLATRFRDISHLINTITRLLFFTTPIIWTLDQRGGVIYNIAIVNPLTHFLEILRAPIMNIDPLPQSWTIVLILTVLNWIIALFASATMSKRLPFWL